MKYCKIETLHSYKFYKVSYLRKNSLDFRFLVKIALDISNDLKVKPQQEFKFKSFI